MTKSSKISKFFSGKRCELSKSLSITSSSSEHADSITALPPGWNCAQRLASYFFPYNRNISHGTRKEGWLAQLLFFSPKVVSGLPASEKIFLCTSSDEGFVVKVGVFLTEK